jgi:enoyl-CoA hydratase/carnithine racemase
MNALSVEVGRELHQAMSDFRDDPELWVGIVTGAGEKAFCGGADIKDTLPFMQAHSQEPWAFPPTIMRGFELWKPLIAAINGMAFGGGLELALACDIRIISEKARLGTTEVTLGLIPGWGGTQRLPRMIPWCKAAEIVLMGKIIDAQEAYRIGLVNAVVPPAEVMTTAREWAQTICQAAPLAVRAAKEAMVRGYSMPLEDGLKLENSLEGYIMTTEDFTEGTTAFVEKRKPDYKAK